MFDCLIIGGGAAGLCAATYLGRFRRSVQVLDGGASRLLSIPTSHNYPGFAGGIHGNDILHRLRAQALQYGAAIDAATVEAITRNDDGSFTAECCDGRRDAHNVIIATGVVDVEPDFPDVKRAVAEGCVRYCPVCDGYESIGKNVAVLGRGKGGFAEALFVRHFAAAVTLLSLDEPIALSADEQARLDRSRVRLAPGPVARLSYDDGGVMQASLCDGGRLHFDVIYAALGTIVNSGLARVLGAECRDDGALLVDAHQQTSVEGLYAAGDVVAGLNQITVAMGQAAIAATAVHHRLGAW